MESEQERGGTLLCCLDQGTWRQEATVSLRENLRGNKRKREEKGEVKEDE